MNDDTEKAKAKIKQQKAKLELKERLLKEKERKQKVKALIDLGSVVAETGIGNLKRVTLIGAFLEIQNRKLDQGNIEKWNKIGEDFLKEKDIQRKTPLIITFEREIDMEVKTQLKKIDFRWNSFRKEWYGYGNKDEIQQMLQPYDCGAELQEAL